MVLSPAFRSAGMAAAAALVFGACATTPASPAASPSPIAPSPTPPPGSTFGPPVAGGCGSTQVFGPPGPSQGPGVALAELPWAPAAPTSAGLTAYFFSADPPFLTAGEPTASGRSNKVLWIAASPAGSELSITAHPLAAAAPIVRMTFPAATSPPGAFPSTIDLPSAGCWHLDIALGTTSATLEILVAPAG